jgi:hypothetical protein
MNHEVLLYVRFEVLTAVKNSMLVFWVMYCHKLSPWNYFTTLRHKYVPNAYNLCSSFEIKDQVSYSYKPIGKIIVLNTSSYSVFSKEKHFPNYFFLFHNDDKKVSKAVPLHAMKAPGVRGGTAPIHS